MKKAILFSALFGFSLYANAGKLLIPMDSTQTDHLRAYGIVFSELENKVQVNWLLNYRGGSFIMESSDDAQQLCADRGVSFELLNPKAEKALDKTITDVSSGMKSVPMVRVPKIAVHVATSSAEWGDAVQEVLKYAGIPFDTITDRDILEGKLVNYDWLHVHHEDFTGQHGKFYASFSGAKWYQDEVAKEGALASELGYTDVPAMKLDVAKHIRTFVEHGGFYFAMCSATDSYDIALASEGHDAVGAIYDGDAADANMNEELNFGNCLAFQNFSIKQNPYEYEFSNIDTYETRSYYVRSLAQDVFQLGNFSAVNATESCMLTQDHERSIKGFWGQTTAFNPSFIKPYVSTLAVCPANGEVRYLHGDLGLGMWTYLGGHDPEDYMHQINEPFTDISKHRNSAGYRLILNNVLISSTKVETAAAVAISAYPNPVTDHLKISFPSLEQNGTYSVKFYDASGKEVMGQMLTSSGGESDIDVTSLSNGNYVMIIEQDGERLSSQKIEVLR